MTNLQKRQLIAVGLSVVSVIGTVASVLLTRQAMKKELKKREQHPDLDLKGKFTQILPIYIPVILTTAVSVASSVGAIVLSRKVETSLTSMLYIADKGYKHYKSEAKKLLPDEEFNDVSNRMAQKEFKQLYGKTAGPGEELFYEERIGFFFAKPIAMIDAHLELNHKLQVSDYGTSWFYAMLDDMLTTSKANVCNPNITPNDIQWGWSRESLLLHNEYIWIHMFWQKEELVDDISGSVVPYNKVVWGEEPVLNPGNYGEHALFEESELVEEYLEKDIQMTMAMKGMVPKKARKK